MPNSIHISVPVDELRPTQITVGFREVKKKRQEWRKADKTGKAYLFRRDVLSAVVGPMGRRYIVDHHHFARALAEEEAGLVAVCILADLEHLTKDEFWTYLDNSAWCHAYDEHGKRRDLEAIPKHLSQLADDPFRSLAGELIRRCACVKSPRPFSEFLWADYLRRRIDRDSVSEDWDQAVARAIVLAYDDAARGLPGWCGPNPAGLWLAM